LRKRESFDRHNKSLPPATERFLPAETQDQRPATRELLPVPRHMWSAGHVSTLVLVLRFFSGVSEVTVFLLAPEGRW
jgi:hypothetical protein